MTPFRLMIPAGGISKRFRDAGWNTPKPDLVLRDPNGREDTMLGHVMRGVPFSLVGPLVLGTRYNVVGPSTPHVRVKAEHTRGQADTLRIMIEKTCSANRPLVVMNTDVVFSSEVISSVVHAVESGSDVGIAVHKSNRDVFSYVDRFPYPRRYAEKMTISEYAMSGVWAFRDSSVLLEALQKVCVDKIEPFLSHALGKMSAIAECVLIDDRQFTDLGTPQAIADAKGWEIVSAKADSNRDE